MDVEKAERVYCQTVSTCIDFRTTLALETNLNESSAGGPCSFLTLSGDRSRRVGGEVPLKLSLHYHASCVLNLFYGGLLPGKKRERKKEQTREKERQIHRKKERVRERERDHHHYGQRYFQRHDAKYIKCHS